ncbi:MAG: acylneuraminate cytidylyltransferase family protein [Bacteroidota bacterium]
MNNVIIIPARGGSKRLPGKHLLDLNDLPLMAHSIIYAKANSAIAEDIYVSTEDPDIKSMALSYGVKVIDRPHELADDHASTVSVLKHALTVLPKAYNNIILLQATNPLRPESLLSEAYSQFVSHGSDSLMTVSTHRKKLGKIVEGHFSPYNYVMGQRSQDMEPLYYENGLLYITSSELIMKDKILGDNNHAFVVDHPYSKVDIDTLEDMKYAQFVIENH